MGMRLTGDELVDEKLYLNIPRPRRRTEFVWAEIGRQLRFWCEPDVGMLLDGRMGNSVTTWELVSVEVERG